jgi:phospholipid/cholesterol/gamma-HCH transport system permease protein
MAKERGKEPGLENITAAVISLPRRLRAADIGAVFREIQARRAEGPVTVDFGNVEEFDSSTLALLSHLQGCASDVRIANIGEALNRSYQSFLGGIPPAACDVPDIGFPTRVLHSFSNRFLSQIRNLAKFLVLLGDELYYVVSYIRKRRGVYPGEIRNQVFFMGYKSFPITCLLIFLVGVTIALTSAAQLKLYGADIYLADLIGYGMLRELVPLMVGVILAGKVGAAVAAELSTMTVLEEVDALKTMGVVPEKFLMVPRLVAITLAVPLLVAVADAVGIAGGILVGRFSLGIVPSAFLREMRTAVDIGDFLIGLEKSIVFGWAVIVGSGYKGLTVGRSAGEVGRATTESVVLSISLIVLIDCIFALILYS